MTAFRNNLKAGDRVLSAEKRRLGDVTVTPRESSRNVSVRWQGCQGAVYVDVLGLRLIVNGQPESVPPCDGEPSPEPARVEVPKSGTAELVDALKLKRDAIRGEMDRMNARYKDLQGEAERIEQAIAVLTK